MNHTTTIEDDLALRFARKCAVSRILWGLVGLTLVILAFMTVRDSNQADHPLSQPWLYIMILMAMRFHYRADQVPEIKNGVIHGGAMEIIERYEIERLREAHIQQSFAAIAGIASSLCFQSAWFPVIVFCLTLLARESYFVRYHPRMR